MRPFTPHPLLHNPHVMTLAAALLPRHSPRLPPAQERLFAVEAGTLLANAIGFGGFYYASMVIGARRPM